MSDDRVIRFGRYSLHPTQGLRLGKREIRVTPKSLSVLRVLAERSGQIVTKDELFERAWPDTVVTDAALTSCVQELRQVLGDRAREPHYIETLHRRGFRFLVPATTIESAEVTRACREPARPAEPIVGREEAIAALDAARRLADAGARQVVVLTGGPGIGKTALVEAFLARIGDGQAAIVARAACVERFGTGEAYQPLLEALVRLCRRPDGPRLLAIVRRHAPSWLAQLPALQTPAEWRGLQRRTAGATRERIQRELSDCLEAIASDRTLVLWIDDVHWSDLSTLDWLSAFAQRPDRARVLILVACRPGTRSPIRCGQRQPSGQTVVPRAYCGGAGRSCDVRAGRPSSGRRARASSGAVAGASDPRADRGASALHQGDPGRTAGPSPADCRRVWSSAVASRCGSRRA